MVNSMTGFGRAEKIVEGRDIIAEVKSVNHRFFDFNLRVSRGYEFLEEKVRPYLQEKIARGKLDVYIEVERPEGAKTDVQMNEPLASGYLSALHAAQQKFGLPDDIRASTLLQLPELFTVRREPEDEEKVWEEVRQVLDAALVPFLAMRRAEGGKMKEDILGRVSAIQDMVGEVENRSPKTVEEYRNKLRERIRDLLGSAPVDEQRILTEAALYADKVSVAEETVRIRSHISQFREMVSSGGPVGRRMDFLVQEMNREANTIGSKCVDAQIAHLVVDMKAEIEKIREQIQNIE